MTPDAAQKEAYTHAYLCFDDYINKLRQPGSPEQREFAQGLPESGFDQLITDACLRLAHDLYRRSSLAAAGISPPDYPDPPPEPEPTAAVPQGVKTVALLKDGTALYDLQRWYQNHLPHHDLMADLHDQGMGLLPFHQLDAEQLDALAEMVECFPNDPGLFEPEFRTEYEPRNARDMAVLLDIDGSAGPIITAGE